MSVKYTHKQLSKLKIDHNGQSDINTNIKKDKVAKGLKTAHSDYSFFLKVLKNELGLQAIEEHIFHPTRQWRFDVAILAHKIAIEIEGGIWMKGGGAHSRPQAIERDMEKYTEASISGWIVIRTTPQNLYKTQTLNYIKQAIEYRKSL